MAKRKLDLHYDASGIDDKLLNKKAEGIRYIGKRKFNKAADKGMQYIFVGKTSLKKAYKDDEEALIFDDHEYRIAEPKFSKFTKVSGYIPVGDKRFLEYRKRPLILIILLLLLLLGCAGGAAWYFWPETPDYTVIAPDYLNTEVDENQEELGEEVSGLIANVYLPLGDVNFEGSLLKAEYELIGMDAETAPANAFYSGIAHIKVYMQKNENDYLIIDSDEEFRDGYFGELNLDFSILKTEITAGLHEGSMDVTYPDGTIVTKPMTIVVRNRFGGTMDIGFSDKVNVYLSGGNIDLEYRSGYLATHDTILQLILDKDGQEFLLAQSGIISPNHSLSRMTLAPEMKSRIVPGTYTGRLRFNFYNDAANTGNIGVNTEVEVDIIVH